MFIRKSSIFILFSVVLFTCIIISCGSVSAEQSISQGDYVTAIETLSSKLAKKPADEKNADLFVSIYPMAMEQKIPEKLVPQIIEDSLPGYKSNSIAVLKRLAGQTSSSLLNQSEISQIIRQSELVISNLNDCIRIQKAVLVVPFQIGNSKKGQIYTIQKYEQDFSSIYNDQTYALGALYYNMAEALYPGDGINQKQEILNYYATAKNYSSAFTSINSKSAEICYQIASEYENSDDSIYNKNNAISWYTKAINWSSGYKDSQTKIYKMNYEIALIYQDSAESVSDYETVLQYLGNAGTYGDSVERKKAITYMLAKAYKEALSSSYYEKAGSYFKSLGNYENAARETYLYDFYKRLVSLPKTSSYGSISLSTGKNNSLNRNLDSATTRYTSLSITKKSTTIPVYSILKEGTILPGSMFHGDSLVTEKYDSFTSGDRAPIDFTIYGGSGWVKLATGDIDAPSTRNGYNDVTEKAYKVRRSLTPTYNIDFYQVYSDDDLEMTLGTGFDRNSVSIGRNADYNSNVVLVKIMQKYYTASMEAPKMPYEFFTTSTSSTVRESSLKSVSPYYIDSVDFGRAAYLVFSTDLPVEDLKTQLEKVYNTSYASSSTRRNVIAVLEKYDTTISGFSIGEKSISLSTFDRFFDWMIDGKDMTSEVDSLPPVSFTLRALSDNSYATLTQTGTFRVLNPNYLKTSDDSTDTTDTKPTRKPGTTVIDTEKTPGIIIKDPITPKYEK